MRDWSDHERFLAFYDLAARDLDELLALSPDAPEAPEALFTMGMIHDYPHLELFDVALEAYQAAVSRFPDSPWAAKARERLGVLNAIMNPGGADPHRGAGPAPGAPR
jgi:outer membrane protein assembly factor BamD (BamD/ComL family)